MGSWQTVGVGRNEENFGGSKTEHWGVDVNPRNGKTYILGNIEAHTPNPRTELITAGTMSLASTLSTECYRTGHGGEHLYSQHSGC
jgi:hypothetical protein